MNRAICPSAGPPALPEIPQAPSASDASAGLFIIRRLDRQAIDRLCCEICEGGALSLRAHRSRLHGKAQLDQAADGFGARCIIRPGPGVSVPRSHHCGRPEARRLIPVGFSFALAGRARQLILPFKLMLLGRGRRIRSQESGGPPPFEPSLKVEGDTAHNQTSGFVAPVS
jgi:hypothetical protein